jgi:hypothetical protein
MQSFRPLSQYLCSACGSVLKETDIEIDIHSVREDCPNCGESLATTLRKQVKSQTAELPLQAPRLRTAYELTQFRFDIPKIDSLLRLPTEGLLYLVGYNANLLLTRLCVRALMSARRGGLDSPYAIFVDAGNNSDIYQTVNFTRQYGMEITNVLDRIIVSRTFTIYQLKSLLSLEVPKIIQSCQAKIVFVSGISDMFESDPNIREKEARRVLARITKTLAKISNRVLVITSFQEGNYADSLLQESSDCVISSKLQQSQIVMTLYKQGKKRVLALTEKDLKYVAKNQGWDIT